MPRRLLAITALLLLSVAAPAWAVVTVHLNPQVTVTAAELKLGDLGSIEGERGLAERVGAVRLGLAPAPGTSFRMDLDQVLVRLRQNRIDPANVRLAGAERVTIVRASQMLGGQAVVDAAAQPALERLQRAAPDGAPYALVPLTRPADLRLPAGAVDLTPQVQEPTPPYAVVLSTVGVRVDGQDVQVVPVSFRVTRLVTVVVATQALEPNRRLSLADFRLEARPSTEVPPSALGAVTDASDLEAVRPIRAGEIVTQHHLRPRIVVKRGENVTLILEGRGFRVTTVGLAVEDARRGDAVRVLNPTSKREVIGRAEATGLVRVQP
jgi:flagella basal body P-ring formation protein FlgA